MKLEKYAYMALIFFICIVSISAINAADDSANDIISANDNNEVNLEKTPQKVSTNNEGLDLEETPQKVSTNAKNNEEIILENRTEEVICSTSTQASTKLGERDNEIVGRSYTVDSANFEDIQSTVNTAQEGDIIYLKDQSYYGSGSEIIVDKSLTFIGNNTILNAQNQSAIFNILENVNSITFRNIKFTGGYNNPYRLIYSRSGNINIINCTFFNNTEGDIYADVIINNTDANVSILDSVYENNTMKGERYPSIVILSNKTILDNFILNNNIQSSDSTIPYTYIKCISENITITNSKFTNNTRRGPHGEIKLNGKNVNISNCIFENNTHKTTTSYYGGSIEVYNENGEWADYIIFDKPVVTINNCSFMNDELEYPNGNIYLIDIFRVSEVNILDCKFENCGGPACRMQGNGDKFIMNNCSFKDMCINGGSRPANQLTSENTSITNCSFENILNYAITGCYNIEISNCNFKNVSGGAQTTGINNITVKDCNFTDISNSALDILYPENSIISNCNFINSSAENGGAINLHESQSHVTNSLIITNCHFENNTATKSGGAIYVQILGNINTTLIENCTFKNNTAPIIDNSIGGGAIYLWHGSSSNNTLINNCNFIDNLAEHGGAILIYADNANITNCNFNNNTAYSGGAICVGAASYIEGGSENKNNVFIDNCNFTDHRYGSVISAGVDNSIISNCKFNNNNARSTVGCSLNGNNNIIENCTFINNTGELLSEENPDILSSGYCTGVALHINGDNYHVNNCTFENNTANVRNGCGAVYIASNYTTIENCRFINNGAIGFAPYSCGGALELYGYYNVTIKSCNFTNNYVQNGALSLGGAILSRVYYNTSIINCIFINNTAGKNSFENGSGGGAIAFTYQANNSAIINCTFEDNTAYGGYCSRNGLISNYVGGGALYFQAKRSNYNVTIANSTFINNKERSDKLTLNQSGASITLTLEGYERYINAIYVSEEYVDNITLNFSNVRYWDSYYKNTDDNPAVESTLARFQAINIEIYDSAGNLVENISGKTNIHGQLNFDFTTLPLANGQYTFLAYHPDNEYYTYINTTGSFELDRTESTLDIEINNITYGENIIVTVRTNIIDTLRLEMPRYYYIYMKESDGGVQTLNIDYPSINGNRTARIVYQGNSRYTPITREVEFTIYRLNTIIDLAVNNASTTNFNVNITVSTQNPEINAGNGTVTIYDGDLIVGEANISNGRADNVPLNVSKAGDNILRVEYSGNDISNANSTLKTVTAIITNTRTSVETVANKYGNVTIKAIVHDENNNIVNEGTVKIIAIYEGIEYLIGESRIIDGAAIIKNTTLEAKEYAINASYEGTDTYNKSSTTSTLAVEKVSTHIDANDLTVTYSSDKYLVITLKDEYNQTISNITISVDLNGLKNYTTDANGQIKIPTKDLATKTYSVNITFNGDNNHIGSNATSKIIINKIDTKLTAPNITATYNENKYIIITLKDANNKAIAKKKVTIKIGSISKTLTTNTQGQVSVSVSQLVPKTYTATINFAGDSSYIKSSGNAKVIVKKATPKMTAKAKTFKVKAKSKVKKYTITLKTNKNKVMKNTKIKLKVNKKNFTAKTNKKGIARFKITNLNKKGKYTAVIKYAGNKYYNKLTKKVKITVKA